MKDGKFVFVGEMNNWMDFRDFCIDYLQNCDTELKFQRFLTSILASLQLSPKMIQEAREALGIPKMTKEELKQAEKLCEEAKNDGKQN